MRTPKQEWVTALRALCGSGADIRFNETVHRWEFLLPCADGEVRGQFWAYFDQPADGVTGLKPFRELDDEGMREALANLERTYVGNPFDGAGTLSRQALNAMRYNRDLHRRHARQRAEYFVDFIHEHRRRLHDHHALVGWRQPVMGESKIVIAKR